MTMQAITQSEYGTPDILKLATVDKPKPLANQVLIRVHAASINFADWAMITGQPFLVRAEAGIQKPKHLIPGSDFAGVVVGLGEAVKQWQVGDQVYGDLSGSGLGTFAEYVCAPDHLIARMPKTLSFTEAAAVPMAAVTALQGIQKAGELAGKRVLVNGASGGVGTYLVQFALAKGADVTAVCSARHVEILQALGIEKVIDYRQHDFVDGQQHYDVIFGVNGYRSLRDYKRALAPKGQYVAIGGTLRQTFEGLLLGSLYSLSGDKKLGSMGVAKPNQDDLHLITEMIEAGAIKPIVDRCYPLAQTADALRYQGEGHSRGKIVVVVVPD